MKLYQLSAAELRDAILNHEVTVVDVIDSLIERIEKRNKDINAIVFPLFEEARKEG